LISEIANNLFKASSHGPFPLPESPGVPGVPQPGASAGQFVPANPVGGDFNSPPPQVDDLTGFVPSTQFGAFTAFVPPAHAAPPPGAPNLGIGGASSLPYFLQSAPLHPAAPSTTLAPPTTEFAPFTAANVPASPVPPATRPSGPPPSPQIPGDAFYFLNEGQSPQPNADALPKQGTTAEPSGLDLRPELAPDLGSTTRPFDPYTIKRDFPLLREQINGRPLVWLDNAATTQKPQSVIDRLVYFYEHENSNVHRGAHTLAARSTDAYEAARQKTARFLNAGSERNIVFVRGATEGINLVAKAWGRQNVKEGDEIVITWLEHHANIVPWQQLCSEVGARLRVAPVDDRGDVIIEQYERLLGPRTRLVALPQVSNALGTIVPVAEMTAAAHRHGACVLVDGAQSVSHMPVDVQAIDCDFFVFSGHKIFAPTGIGVVYGKSAVLAHMPPWQGGGNMIADVTFERTLYQPPPGRFEAGTGSIADAVGLGAALDYVESIGRGVIERYEHELLVYATERILTVPGLTLIGTAREKASVLSFVLDGCRSEDVGRALNQEGIAVRAGHHCAQPILRRFGLESTVRPSLAFYNTKDDVDALVAALLRMQATHARA
jgi:cysteine desulfurase/selenocysteine lyase